MTDMNQAPAPFVMGAAMTSKKLPQFAEWLLEKQRDVEIQDPAYPNWLDGDWKSTADEVCRLLDGHTGRRGVHAPFYSLTLAAFDTKIRAVVSERLKQSLEFCAAIGGTHMVIHSPANYLGNPYLPNTPDMAQGDYLKVVLDTLAEVVPMAEKLGCTLMIENIFDKVPGLLVALVKGFNSENVRISIDTGHAYVNFKLGAPPPDRWVKEAGALLGHLHIQDTDGYADRHWAPGDGEIRWASLFSTLRSLEHTPRMVLELMDTQDISRAMAYLSTNGFAL